jgi:hypothetical protein
MVEKANLYYKLFINWTNEGVKSAVLYFLYFYFYFALQKHLQREICLIFVTSSHLIVLILNRLITTSSLSLSLSLSLVSYLIQFLRVYSKYRPQAWGDGFICYTWHAPRGTLSSGEPSHVDVIQSIFLTFQIGFQEMGPQPSKYGDSSWLLCCWNGRAPFIKRFSLSFSFIILISIHYNSIYRKRTCQKNRS